MRSALVVVGLVAGLTAATAGIAAPESHSPARTATAGGVPLVSFTSVRIGTSRKVNVKWRTGAEPGVLGFRLSRVVGTKSTRIGTLFRSKGSTGGTYAYKDLLPKTVKRACYSLSEVLETGASSAFAKTCMKK
jgi:hypothetical protein